ncbi:clock-controlled protein 6 [Apiospora rasikravindrae]|uniref:Clock-controlled protein 6 n=1 Tax=Apiospora rasikravindrae TaxID=990691 RepID=A0ABR1U1T8_9PEZI
MHTRNILLLPFLSGLAAAQVTLATTTAAPSSTMNETSMASGAVMSSWVYYNTTVTATTVVKELTTVCAEPTTTFTFNGCVYPATQGQTVTVTNCPCTITATKPTLTSSLCTTPATGAAATGKDSDKSSPSGGAIVPPGMNDANGTSGMSMGGSNNGPGASAKATATPSSPKSLPSGAVEVNGAQKQQKKSLAGLAVAALGVFALGGL